MSTTEPGTHNGFVRRAPFIIAWWTDHGGHVMNYALGAEIHADALTLSILEHASSWIRVDELETLLDRWPPSRVRAALQALVDRRMLQSMDRAPPREERGLESWRGWNPAAGFFHRATRAEKWEPVGPGSGPPLVCLDDAPPLGQHRPGDRLLLPEFDRHGPLADTLLDRRTWRRFGQRAVTARELSTLLGLSFGIQQWMVVPGERLPLRTSPSGGGRHSLEAYVLVHDVEGIPSGTYHYCPETHALLLLDGTTTRADTERLFPQGSGFDRPSAVVFTTSLFGRVQRKYDFPRAYRVVLLEAGHFCQTFCLVATSLGLAPFCTAAFVDVAVERLLRIDGIREAVIYAMGVGSRPVGQTWAPWPFDAELPPTSPPAFASRFAARTAPGAEPARELVAPEVVVSEADGDP
ncbi:MAG TPA: SagB/ThcOx family dehydrogenase [Longimicrobiales bacterium]